MRKIIDENGRLFGLISVIDVVVLALVVILAVAVFAKFNLLDTPLTTTNTVNITYTVEIKTLRKTTTEMFRPGDALFTDSYTFVGTITNVKVTDAAVVESLIDGTFARATAHERYDVLLTVETQATINNGRYYADRLYEISANSSERFQTKYVETTGTIVTVIES